MSDVHEARLDDALLASVLRPYKPGCRYLDRAVARYDIDGAPARLHGHLAIPESWYIDDTGHFNAIEFNICYNQMIYALMAQCVVSKVIDAFAAMTLDEYLARQLPDVLIHDFQSRFRQPILAAAFEGEVVIESVRDRRRFLLVKTSIRFWDDAGGASDGAVTLAIVNREAGNAARPAESARPAQG